MPAGSIHSNFSSQSTRTPSKFDKLIHDDKPTFKSQYTSDSNDSVSLKSSHSRNNASSNVAAADRARKGSLHSLYRSFSQSSGTPFNHSAHETEKESTPLSNKLNDMIPSLTSNPSKTKKMKKSSRNILKKTLSSLSINAMDNNFDGHHHSHDNNKNTSELGTDSINNPSSASNYTTVQTNARLQHLPMSSHIHSPSNNSHSSSQQQQPQKQQQQQHFPYNHPSFIPNPPRKTSLAGSILKRLSGNSSSKNKSKNKEKDGNDRDDDNNMFFVSERNRSRDKIQASHRNSILVRSNTDQLPTGNRKLSTTSGGVAIGTGPSTRKDSKTSSTSTDIESAPQEQKPPGITNSTVTTSNIPGLFPLDTNLDDLTDITKAVIPQNKKDQEDVINPHRINTTVADNKHSDTIDTIIDLNFKSNTNPQPKRPYSQVTPAKSGTSLVTGVRNSSNDDIKPLPHSNIAKAILKRSSVGNEQHSTEKNANIEAAIGDITPSPSNSLSNIKTALNPKKSHSVGDFPAWSMTTSNDSISTTVTDSVRNKNNALSTSKDSSNTKLNNENKWVAPESWDVDPAIDRKKNKSKKKLKKRLRRQKRMLMLQQEKNSSTASVANPSSTKSSNLMISNISSSSFSDSDSDFSTDSDSDSDSSSESTSSSEVYYGNVDNIQHDNGDFKNSSDMSTRGKLKRSKSIWDSSKEDTPTRAFSSVNLSTDDTKTAFNPSINKSSQVATGDSTVNLPTLTALEDDRIDHVEVELEHYYKDSGDFDSKKHYAIRIFNVDGTFTTLSCIPGTTVEDMIPTLKKKFNITQRSNYQISLKVGKLSKILRPTSKPIVIQRKLLLLNGYKKSDPLHIIGIEDLSFVFKFLFHPVTPSHFTPEQEQRLLRSDFVHVDLRNMDLTTPPIIFYQHTSEIESLDVSNNANIFLPLEFIESTIKLMSLRMVNVRASRFPVNLTEAYKLVSLELQRNFIKKVPKTISKLGNLTILNLQCNELDKLPNSFGLLKNLQLLDLSSNKFVSYPEVINNCTNLLQVDLSYNKIHNIPNTINQLKKLAKVNLSHNKLVEIDSLSDMKNLRTLNLRYNRITTVNTVAPNLQNLFLTDNRISNFEDVLPKLRTLELQENPITSISFKDFYPLNMTSLILSKAQLSSIPGELFTELSRLEKLELSENNLSSLPKEIGLLSKLIYLSVARNKLESLPVEFSQLKSLRSLDLHYNNIREFFDGIEEIELTYLNISSNAFGSMSSLDNAILPNLSENNKLVSSLLFLVAADNQFSDEMWPFFNKFTNLKLLNVSYNNFTDVSTMGLDNLTELYISGNKLSTIPSEIVLKWKELKVLMLNGNQLLTLPAELSQLSQLTTFDLGSNQLKYNISNYHYDWNWRENKELKYLNFSANRKFEIRSSVNHETGADFSDLNVLPNLKVLGLMDVTLNTSKVPDENSNFRLRTTASIINGMRYGVADSLGQRDHVSTRDVTFERFRGNDDECLICLHDSKNQNSDYGHNISRIVRDIYDKILIRQLEKYGDNNDEDIKRALRFSSLQLNKEINSMLNSVDNGASVENLTSADLLSGACSTVVYIKKDKIFTANLGDCMAILCKNNGDFQSLTKQHLPTKREEYERIRISGGYVNNGMLDGVADVSRAVGFFDLLPHIHASPDISLTTLSATDDMLIIATHKLWEYLDIEMACDIARENSSQPMIAAEAMKDHAIAYGCSENLTIICLSLHASTEQENHFTLNKNALLTRRSTFEDTTLRRLQPEISPPTGNLAVVFTDIKNSTFLWELFPNAMRTAIKTHNDLMRRQLRIFGGYEVKTEGDAFMVTFPTPTSALAWCLNVQLKLLDVQWPEEITSIQDGGLVTDSNGVKIYQGLSVRMGMHWGHPVTELDLVTQRMDYLGPVVNKASRVSSVADGGQTTLSMDFVSEFNKIMKYHKMVTEEGKTLEEAYGEEIVGEVLEREITMLESISWTFFDHGEQKLKGLETKEFITIVYPKILSSRHEFIKKDSEAKTIDEDLMFSLRTTSNRLEAILSAVSGGSLELENPKSNYSALNSETRTAIVKSVTERELLAFFDHLVTRIESAVVLLQLRQKTQGGLTIYNKSERVGTAETIFELLDEVLACYNAVQK